MNIQAEFDLSALADGCREVTISRYSRAANQHPIQKTTLIFSIRFTLHAEALQWNVNGVDKMDFQCHSTFLKSFVCDFVPPVTTTQPASCWTNHLSQIANPPGVTAYQCFFFFFFFTQKSVWGGSVWLCPWLKWEEISGWKSQFHPSGLQWPFTLMHLNWEEVYFTWTRLILM